MKLDDKHFEAMCTAQDNLCKKAIEYAHQLARLGIHAYDEKYALDNPETHRLRSYVDLARDALMLAADLYVCADKIESIKNMKIDG